LMPVWMFSVLDKAVRVEIFLCYCPIDDVY